MAIDTIKASAILDGSVTSADLDTNIAITGDLTVDTNTLYVDSTNNRVGIGTSSPTKLLHVESDSGPTIRVTDTTGDNETTLNVASGSNYNIVAMPTSGSNAYGLEIRQGSSTRLSILNGGGITFNGDTAAANALDDYEEGTWEPTLEGVSSNPTVSYQADTGGYYIKIGRMVYLTGTVRTTSVSGGSGTVLVGGLPFSIASRTNGDNADGVGAVRCVIWDGTSTTVPTIVQMKHGSANLNIMSSRHDGTTTTLQVSNWGNSCMIAFNITIYTN